MPRNAEVIRQWTILRDLEASRRLTIDDMAERTGVTTRTIRRDLEALQSAGFPLYDETHDGKRYWTLEQRAFRRLDDTGFTLAELSALYFSRTLVECLASTPFQRDVRSAFDKLSAALTPGMRQFLDRLPLAIQAKAEPGSRAAVPSPDGASPDAKQAAARSARIAQLLDGILHHRRTAMRYHSFSSNREKEYVIEPHRLVFAQGGLYLVAFVPEYGQQRTFAVDRIQTMSVLEERFEPVEVDEEAFAHSLGVNQGTPPERIEISFEPRIARYVRERVWHGSQEPLDQPDGSLILVLNVSNDWALRSWILGFGPLARVIAPSALASQILEDLERARAQYVPGLDFELPEGE
jgi:predicted DNA-binding transcriptional regulator YafY